MASDADEELHSMVKSIVDELEAAVVYSPEVRS